MCKSVQDGGQRCASHTRARLARAQTALHSAALAGDPAKVAAARDEWFTAASEYASTAEGQQKMTDLRSSALAASDFESEAMYGSVLTKGAQIREANEAAAAAIAARQGGTAVLDRPVPSLGARMTPIGGGASGPPVPPAPSASTPDGGTVPGSVDAGLAASGPATQDEGRAQNARWLYQNSDPRKIAWTGPAGGLSRDQVVESLRMASDPSATGDIEHAYYNLRRLRTGIAKSKPSQFGAHRDEAVRRADMALADLLDRPGVPAPVAADALAWSTATGNSVLRDRMLAHPALPARALATYQPQPAHPPVGQEAWASIRARSTRSPAAATFAYKNHPDPAARAQAAANMAQMPFAELDEDETQALRTWLSTPSWSKVENGTITATRTMTLASATGTNPDRELMAYASATQPPRRVHVPGGGREPTPGAVTVSPRMLAHAYSERARVVDAIERSANTYLGQRYSSGWRRDPDVPSGIKPTTPSWMKHPHVQQALGFAPVPSSGPGNLSTDTSMPRSGPTSVSPATEPGRIAMLRAALARRRSRR